MRAWQLKSLFKFPSVEEAIWTEIQNWYGWSSWIQCFWVSCLESIQFGKLNTVTGCPDRLWNLFKRWLDRVLGNLHWVILLEQGNWSRQSQEVSSSLSHSMTLGFIFLWTSGIQGVLRGLKMQPVFDFREQPLVSFLTKYNFLSRLFIVNNMLPLFLFSGLLYSAWMQSSSSLKGCCRWTKLFPIFLYRSGF